MKFASSEVIIENPVRKNPSSLTMVISASVVGTLIEFYDLILAIALAPVLSQYFFPASDARLLETLAIVVTAYFARPIGALIFGKLGDASGRKKPLLISFFLMGSATFLTGCLPGFASVGWLAPVLLLMLRVLQGLAISGEYTAASIYIAEHVASNRRGFYTGFIQSTIPLSLLLCLSIIFLVQHSMTTADFHSFGWRLPFLFSGVLVIFGYWIRNKLKETPQYALLQVQKKTSAHPVKDTLSDKRNIKTMLLLIFGGCAAQGTLMQTTHFVMLFYLQRVVFLDMETSFLIMAIATLIGCPFFQFFGGLSDKVGRKTIILPGLVLSLILIPLVFYLISSEGNPTSLATPHSINTLPLLTITAMVTSLHICCAMVYGPLGAFLLESFPATFRFTGMGLVYNIGNGVLGGSTTFISELFRWLIPTLAIAAFSSTLIYPLFLILIAIIINAWLIPETNKNN